MADVHLLLLDVHQRVGVRARLRVEQQRVATHRRLRPHGAGVHLQRAAIARTAAALRDGLRDDGRCRVGRSVDDLRAGVLVLAARGHRERKDLAVGVRPHQVHARVLHCELRAEVAIDPLHHGALVRGGALRHEVVDVRRPVLDRRVADTRILLDDDLDDGAVERVGRVRRRRAAFDVVHVAAFLGDDQRPFELTHVFLVDAEVGLERDVDLDPGGHVHEAAARPDGAVQRGELVVGWRDDRAEILLDHLGVVTHGRVHIREDHAELLEILADAVVDDFRVVLRANAGDQRLLLRLRDAELVEGVLDVLRHVVPVLLGPIRRARIVVDVIEVEIVVLDAAAPEARRHRLLKEVLVRAQAEVPHPFVLVLRGRNLAHDAFVQALLCAVGVRRVVVVVEAELVTVLRRELRCNLRNHTRPSLPSRRLAPVRTSQ